MRGDVRVEWEELNWHDFLLLMNYDLCDWNDAGMRGDVRAEWEELKQHDVLFLLSIRPPEHPVSQEEDLTPAQRYGLLYIRGCEVIEVRPPTLTPRIPSVQLCKHFCCPFCCPFFVYRTLWAFCKG